jgi:hypothetical protein
LVSAGGADIPVCLLPFAAEAGIVADKNGGVGFGCLGET